jgi:transposase
MLSREDIKVAYEQGPDAVVALVEGLITHFQQQIEQLQTQVKELQDRLALNSSNSSKPPASNPPAQRTKSLRTASSKKPGAQPGHTGATLTATPTPDEVVVHSAITCGGCGQSLTEVTGQETTDRRQVFDLPPLKLTVTEHRVCEKRCPFCATLNGATFPVEVPPGTSYGPNFKSLAVYLVEEQLLPWQRTCGLLRDVFGQPLAEGTLGSALQQCANGLAKPEAAIKQALTQAPVAHFDESGLYVAGRREWLHVASTAQLTHYGTHAKRGTVAMDEIAILPKFKGRALHDGWASYFAYACAHGLCNAHHLRELTFVEEQLAQSWAREMKDLLLEIKAAVEQAQTQDASSLPERQQTQFEKSYDEILATGLALPANQPPPPDGKRGRRKQSKAKNLLNRLSKYKAETLAFMYDFQVPFDNNQAERDVRMVKVQQKVSGCFRSRNGAQTFCRIRGYISTMKKQGRNVLAALSSVFTGQPLSPLPDG